MLTYIRPVVFPDLGICYLENPKAGSSSLLDQVAEYGGIQRPGGRGAARLGHVRSNATLDARLMPAMCKAPLVAPGANRLVFSFVRNPYVRLLSAYLDLIERPVQSSLHRLQVFGVNEQISFDGFVRTIVKQRITEMNFHWRPQSALLSPESVSYDFIGRMERFGQDVDRLFGDSESPYSGRGMENRTGAAQLVTRYYDEELADIVGRHYHADFARFGYSKEIDKLDAFDDDVLPRGQSAWRTSLVKPGRWHVAAAATRGLNTVQRSPLWAVAWRLRKTIARVRASV